MNVAQFPHLLVMCTRHRLAEVVTAMQSGWRQLEEVLARNHAQNLPEKVYLPQRIFKLGFTRLQQQRVAATDDAAKRATGI